MVNDILIWLALLFGLIFLVVDTRRGIGALTLAYFLELSLGHVPGLLAHLDDTFLLEAGSATKLGFNVTLIGMTALIVGAAAARMLPPRTTRAYQPMVSADSFSRLGWRVFATGIVAYFVLLPVSALVPSFTAVASAMGTLLIVGFWLRLYAARLRDNSRDMLSVLIVLPLLPLATLSTGGFIGFGTVWALSVVTFCFVLVRRRIWFYLAAPFVIFLGLSLFVTYFQQRDDIRGVVWNRKSDMLERLEKVSSLITDFQFLDLSNERHLLALDQRLNQNYLVGVGVVRHQQGASHLWYGATVPFWALIPRVIWPDKPAVGGGGDLVSEFTGIDFAEGTSVGTGQVLEFYMNFAMPGVVGGFAILGFILMRLDQRLMVHFNMRNINGVMVTVLPGLALLQPLGNLKEIIVAVISAIVTSRALVYFKLMSAPPTKRPSDELSAQKMRAIWRW